MKIIIETIPHKQQRYETCGDWWVDSDGTIQIRISEMPPDSAGAVAIHELVELFCCSKGFTITQNQLECLVAEVDAFDKTYQGDDEPGDNPFAPYHVEHSIATAVERLICAHIKLPWGTHDKRVEGLFS